MKKHFIFMIALCLASGPALAAEELQEGITAEDVNVSLMNSGQAIRANLYYFQKVAPAEGLLWWKVPTRNAAKNKAVLATYERPCFLQQLKAVKEVDWKKLGIDPAKVQSDLISYREAHLNGFLWRATVNVQPEQDKKVSPEVIVTAYVHKRSKNDEAQCNTASAKEITEKVQQVYDSLYAKGVEAGKVTAKEKASFFQQVEESPGNTRAD